MKRAAETLRSLAARRGIDLAALAAQPGAPVLDPRGWHHEDPVGWRLQQAEAVLAYELRSKFAAARADHPAVAGWVAKHLADPARYPSLLLLGEQGVGKTHQGCGILREVSLAAAHANRRCRWRMVTHADLSAELRPKPDGSHAYALEPYEQADLTFFDDIGSGSLNDFGVEGALRLIDYRYRRGLASIYATNLNDEGLQSAFGSRIPSRLYEGAVVVLDGPDRRPAMGEWYD